MLFVTPRSINIHNLILIKSDAGWQLPKLLLVCRECTELQWENPQKLHSSVGQILKISTKRHMTFLIVYCIYLRNVAVSPSRPTDLVSSSAAIFHSFRGVEAWVAFACSLFPLHFVFSSLCCFRRFHSGFFFYLQIANAHKTGGLKHPEEAVWSVF